MLGSCFAKYKVVEPLSTNRELVASMSSIAFAAISFFSPMLNPTRAENCSSVFLESSFKETAPPRTRMMSPSFSSAQRSLRKVISE